MTKSFLLAIIITVPALTAFTQSSEDQAHAQATVLMQRTQYDDALKLLNESLKNQPDNTQLLKDKMYALYLKRDYAGALETGNKLVEKEDADEQTFQLTGIVYKAIADYKSADKLYRDAFKKFPKSAVLYSEYGDLLYQSDNKKNAILSWEKGIESNGDYSSNYYYAAKYYAETGNLLWSITYSEIFVNLESVSQRTTEIKKLLLQDYDNLFKNAESVYNLAIKGNAFEKAVASTITESLNDFLNQPTPDGITAFRTRFILNWYNSNSKQYSYRLYDVQHQFLENGYYDAYNQWLFGSVINADRYNNWASLHDVEMKDFQQYQRNALFKVPPENYYEH